MVDKIMMIFVVYFVMVFIFNMYISMMRVDKIEV